MPSVEPISKINTGYPDYLDFRRLRELGLTHIQQYSGNLWTDHNLHDPGITMLEELCYALLDLGYRTGFSVPDLLAGASSEDQGAVKHFFTAAEILSNNPLTITDYRKLLLDIRGVRNAWLEKAEQAEVDLFLNCKTGALSTGQGTPASAGNSCACTADLPTADDPTQLVRLNGLYRVLLELEPIRPEDTVSKAGDGLSVDRILAEARARLQAHRNLCEDFLDIQVLQDEQIAICAHIEIAPDYDPEDVLVDMYERLRKALSPAVSFYTLNQLLQKGLPIEEVFEGRPLLPDSHGFIDTAELDQLQLPVELHASDLYRIILDNNPGILAVRKLLLFNYIDGQPQTSGADWCLHLTPGYHPVLAPELCKITLFKDGVPFAANQKEVLNRYQDRLSSARKNTLKPYDLDLPVPEGVYRNPGEYWSIQHDFPAVYGIGEGGLPESAPPNRKAQALQLKAFLLFFDQLLANYLAQLAHLRDFFALQPTSFSRRTYFPGDVSSIPDLAMLIRGGDFEQQGEPITGSSILYRRGSVIVFPFDEQTDSGIYTDYQFFDNPRQRDDVIRSAQAAFEHDTYSIRAAEDACGLYCFEIQIPMDLPGGGKMLVLHSKPAFKDPDLAKREGEALTFLGLSGDHYRAVDHPSDAAYTFELVYEPRPYAQILEHLAETSQTALARRDKFLNHLLARFAEDFTDYALLQIDNTGKQRPLSELVTDKEQFLAEYPGISRNRGRGFDYTATGHLWDTDNITGLENRAGALMGLDPRTRHTLAPFEVFEAGNWPEYRLHDFRCRTLWVNQKYFASFDAFQAKVMELAADCKNYRRVGCGDYSRYSFVLVENAGTPQECIVAVHPDTYPTPEQRDAIMAYFAGPPGAPGAPCAGTPGGIFAGLDSALMSGTGVYLKIGKTEMGNVFSVIKPAADGTPIVLLKSVHAYDTTPELMAAWAIFADLALQEAHYHLLADPYGKGYSFEVRNPDGDPLAKHPGYYSTEDGAQAGISETLDWIRAHRPDTELSQEPDVWIWQFTDGQGKILLESLYGFETSEQAAAALNNALSITRSADNWEPATDADGKYSFFLLQSYPATDDQAAYSIRLARHPAVYDDPAVRNGMLRTAQIQTDASAFFNKHLVAKNRAFLPQWADAATEILLEGTGIYIDKTAAQTAFGAMVERAKNSAAFTYDQTETRQVWLLDPQGKVMAHSVATFDTPELAQGFVQSLTAAAAAGQALFQTRQIDKAYAITLTDANGKKVLNGKQWYAQADEARVAYLGALHAARQPESFQAIDETGPTIRLKGPEGNVLAESAILDTAEQRDDTLGVLREYYGSDRIQPLQIACPGVWHFTILKDEQTVLLSAQDYASEQDAATALETTLQAAADLAHYQPTKASDGCLFSFVIQGTDESDLLATHPFWYSTEPARDAAMAALAGWFAEHTLPANPEWQDPEYFYQLCWESCDERIVPVLVGTVPYQSEADAQLAFEALQDSFLALAPDQKTSLFEHANQYSFCFAQGDDLAVDPHWYDTAKLRDAALLHLTEGIRNELVEFRYIQQDQRWHYEACWPPCDASALPALLGKTSYENREDAQMAVYALQQRVAQQSISAFQGTEGQFSFSLSGGALLNPDTYDSLEEMNLAMGQLADYIRLLNWKKAACEPLPDIPAPAPASQPEEQKAVSRMASEPTANTYPLAAVRYGYRLRKPDGMLAEYQPHFASATERDTALCTIQRTLACQLPEYSSIDCDSGTVVVTPKPKKRYVYRIKSGNVVWWISADTFATPEEAWAAFDANYLTILDLASHMANYQTVCQDGVACYFWLPVPGDPTKPIARTPDFLPGADLVAEFEKRQRHARTYPVHRQPGGGFGFRIVDPVSNHLLWTSSQVFDSDKAALEAFYVFLDLLRFPANYVPVNEPAKGYFGIALWEPGLESQEYFEATPNQEYPSALPATAAENAWEGLNDFLLDFGNGINFVTWQDVAGGCRFGLGLASNGYRLAIHPSVYHTPAEREAARNELFHQVQCSGLTAKKCENNWFVPLCNSGLITYERATIQPSVKWNLMPESGLLHFEENPDDPCANDNEAQIEVETIIDLMAIARAKECYVGVVNPNEADNPAAKRCLGLLNGQFQLTATSVEAYDPGVWEKCRDEAIEQAWEFPLVRRGDGFGFQLAIGQQVVLESAQTYSDPKLAYSAYCRMLELLRDKSNLVGAESGPCGPFGIELRDPTELKALHPATYSDQDSALAAAEALERCLDAEGFHLIEHILLRPRMPEPVHYFVLKAGNKVLLKSACPVSNADLKTPQAYAQARAAFMERVHAALIQTIGGFNHLQLAISKGNQSTPVAESENAVLLLNLVIWDLDKKAFRFDFDTSTVQVVKQNQLYYPGVIKDGITLAVGTTPIASGGSNPPTLTAQEKEQFLNALNETLLSYLEQEQCVLYDTLLTDENGCAIAASPEQLTVLAHRQALLKIDASNDAFLDVSPSLTGGVKLGLRFELNFQNVPAGIPPFLSLFSVPESIARDPVELEKAKIKFSQDVLKGLTILFQKKELVRLRAADAAGVISVVAVSDQAYTPEETYALLQKTFTKVDLEAGGAGKPSYLVLLDSDNTTVLFRSTRALTTQELTDPKLLQGAKDAFLKQVKAGVAGFLAAKNTLSLRLLDDEKAPYFARSAQGLTLEQMQELSPATHPDLEAQVALQLNPTNWIPPAQCWSIQHNAEILLLSDSPVADISVNFSESRQAFIDDVTQALTALKFDKPEPDCQKLPIRLYDTASKLIASSPIAYTQADRKTLVEWLSVQLAKIKSDGTAEIGILLADKYTNAGKPCQNDATTSPDPAAPTLQLLEACAEPDACAGAGPDDYLAGADPYSFWATVAIPHWGRRFRNVQFRQFFEKTLRSEAPAHVALRIGWISPYQMMQLEKAWRAWLEAQALGDGSCALSDAQQQLICILQALRNRYPKAQLHDCEAGGEQGSEFVLLDHTILSE